MENVDTTFWQGSRKRFDNLREAKQLVKGCIYFVGDSITPEENGLEFSKTGVVYVAVSTTFAVIFGSYNCETDIEDIKNKLATIESGAEVNLINDVTVNGESVVSDKVADITIKEPVVKTITQQYTDGSQLQKVFSVQSGKSVIINIKVSQYNQVYTDTLYYAPLNTPGEGTFYCNYHQPFIESRTVSDILPICVSIPTKAHQQAPGETIEMTVVYGEDYITWYDNEFIESHKFDRKCEKVSATIDLGNSTALFTDSSGNLMNEIGEAVTSLEDEYLYTINASSSDGAFTIPDRTDYANTQIYCFGSGTATLGTATLDYNNGKTIVINGAEMVIAEAVKDYYTKEETDTKLEGKASVTALTEEQTARTTADTTLQENIDKATTPAEIEIVTEDTGYTKEEIDAKLADYIQITDIIPYEDIINLE